MSSKRDVLFHPRWGTRTARLVVATASRSGRLRSDEGGSASAESTRLPALRLDRPAQLSQPRCNLRQPRPRQGPGNLVLLELLPTCRDGAVVRGWESGFPSRRSRVRVPPSASRSRRFPGRKQRPRPPVPQTSRRAMKRSRFTGMALRDLWRKLTRRRAEDKELDTRPGLNKLPATGHFVQPPPPAPGQEKPKH
jgi:hypothetical protein